MNTSKTPAGGNNKDSKSDKGKAEAKPGGDGKSGGKDTRPADAKDTRPADAKDTRPAGAKDTRPAGAKDTRPADAKDTRPADAKDTKPTDQAPAGARSPEAEPAAAARPAVEEKPAPVAAKPAAEAKPAPAAETKPAPAAEAKPVPATADGDEEAVEALIDPEELPTDAPDSPAPPPGRAPAGDARSFRRDYPSPGEFAFVYRSGTYLIVRAGKVGRQGTWNRVEYPSIGAAAHAYADECSRWVEQGYRDH
jgi:hypothetical protein